MTEFSVLLLAASDTAPQAAAEDWGLLFFWIAVPAVILATLVAGWIKWKVLSRPGFRKYRPSWRAFAWVATADMVAWAVLWPALLVVRVRGVGDGRALWVVALLMVVALGYVANRYGFSRAFDPAVAGSLRGTLLAELFTILMPVLAVLFGLAGYWLVSVMGGGP